MHSCWKELVAHYADKKHQICNCGLAYYSKIRTPDLQWACKGGCDAARYDAKEYIAERAIHDLDYFKAMIDEISTFKMH